MQVSEVQDRKYEHPQTSNLLAVLKDNKLIQDVLFEMEKMSADTTVKPGNFSVSVQILSCVILNALFHNATDGNWSTVNQIFLHQ